MTPARKPLLSNKNIKARLEFGLKYQEWTVDDWRKVMFSDETKVNLMGSDGRKYTWKSRNEPLQRKHSKITVKHDSYIIVWGCFSSNGVGNICTIEGNMNAKMYNRILSDQMFPSAQRLIGSNYVFQQDNDPKHTSGAVQNFLKKKKVKVLDWPSQSPDLNPIENLWFKLKRDIHQEKCTKKTELAAVMKKCWSMITPEYCEALIESMPRRMDKVVAAKGLWTKY